MYKRQTPSSESKATEWLLSNGNNIESMNRLAGQVSPEKCPLSPVVNLPGKNTQGLVRCRQKVLMDKIYLKILVGISILGNARFLILHFFPLQIQINQIR